MGHYRHSGKAHEMGGLSWIRREGPRLGGAHLPSNVGFASRNSAALVTRFGNIDSHDSSEPPAMFVHVFSTSSNPEPKCDGYFRLVHPSCGLTRRSVDFFYSKWG